MKPPLMTDLLEWWAEFRKAARNRGRSAWDTGQTGTSALATFIERNRARRRKLP